MKPWLGRIVLTDRRQIVERYKQDIGPPDEQGIAEFALQKELVQSHRLGGICCNNGGVVAVRFFSFRHFHLRPFTASPGFPAINVNARFRIVDVHFKASFGQAGTAALHSFAPVNVPVHLSDDCINAVQIGVSQKL